LADPALYAVYLGGDPPDGRMGEDHEVVFVVAGDDMKEVRRLARAKWRGVSKPHVDAVQRLDRVDGHEIRLSAAEPGDASVLDPEFHDSD
jgi:hypothetical protein